MRKTFARRILLFQRDLFGRNFNLVNRSFVDVLFFLREA